MRKLAAILFFIPSFVMGQIQIIELDETVLNSNWTLDGQSISQNLTVGLFGENLNINIVITPQSSFTGPLPGFVRISDINYLSGPEDIFFSTFQVSSPCPFVDQNFVLYRYLLNESVSNANSYTGGGYLFTTYGNTFGPPYDFCDGLMMSPGDSQDMHLGFRVKDSDQLWHYGWISINLSVGVNEMSVHLDELAIEGTPMAYINAGSTTSSAVPSNLDQTYNVNGINLNWDPFPNSVACQIKGGFSGGTEPHSFIIQGIEPTEKFIYGGSLIIGQEYQWKVRCATGLNPYSGITPWSAYDYFIYDP
ncbi:MAG: hypothetical protein HKN39_06200 [Flavobacteriales bacterium]|nr:hypothetical protein [Flavobacteriales bacterium]